MPCPDSSLLQQFAFGRLESAEEERIETHLEQCSACRERLSELERAGDDSLFQKIREANLHEVSRSENSGDSSDHSSEHPSESLPETIGNYKILGLLGRGGMGTVYKGLNPHLNREVAIKVVRSSRSFRESALKRFQQEMFAAGKLQHPNIVQALDAGVFENRPYLVLELLEGSDFSHYVKEHGPLSVSEACDAVRQTALGLQHAHDAGLVHRDIKPSNLWRTPDGTVKILDLGLARLLGTENAAKEETGADSPAASDTLEGQVLGSPDYMSPEQAANPKEVDFRTDLYSLGATFFFLLTGNPPFNEEKHSTVAGKIEAHSKELMPSLKLFRNDVPNKVENLLKNLVSKTATTRLDSAAEIVKTLDRFSGSFFRNRFLYGSLFILIAGAIIGLTLFPKEIPTAQEAPRSQVIEEISIHSPKEPEPDLFAEQNFSWNTIQTIPTGSAPPNTAFFTADGNGIIEGRRNGDIYLWDVASGKQLFIFEPGNSPIRSMALSWNKTLLAAGCENGFINIWYAQSGKVKDAFSLSKPVTSVCYSLDSQRLFAGTDNYGVLFRTADGKVLGSLKYPEIEKEKKKEKRENNIVSSLFSPNGKNIYGFSENGTLMCFDSIKKTEICSERYDGDQFSLNISPGLNNLAVADGSDSTKIIPCSIDESAECEFDFRASKAQTKTFCSPDSSIQLCAISPNQRLLVTGEQVSNRENQDFVLRFWDMKTGETGLTIPLTSENGPIESIDFSQDGKRLLVRQIKQGFITVFEQQNGELVYWKPAAPPVQVPFETEEETLALNTKLEKLGATYNDWKLVHTFPGSLGDFDSAFFAFDGNEIIDVQAPGYIQRWHNHGGKGLNIKMPRAITAFAVSWDHRYFAIADRAGSFNRNSGSNIGPGLNWGAPSRKNGSVKPDGEKNQNCSVEIRDMQKGIRVRTITPLVLDGPITTLSFSFDGKRLFLGGPCGEVWDVEDEKSEPVVILRKDMGYIITSTFSPNGNDILFGDNKKNLYRYSSYSGKKEERYPEFKSNVSCLKYGSNFRRLYIADGTSKITVFSWNSPSSRHMYPFSYDSKYNIIHPKADARIYCLAGCRDAEHLLLGGDALLDIWNLKTKTVETSLPVIDPEECILALDYTPNGRKFLARMLLGGQIQLWENTSKDKITVYKQEVPQPFSEDIIRGVKQEIIQPDFKGYLPNRSANNKSSFQITWDEERDAYAKRPRVDMVRCDSNKTKP